MVEQQPRTRRPRLGTNVKRGEFLAEMQHREHSGSNEPRAQPPLPVRERSEN